MNKYCILLFFCFLFSVSALWGQQKATPKPGEGISTFLLRHNRAPKKYYDDFIKLNEAKLGKGQTLKLGVTYLIPPVKKKVPASVTTAGSAAKKENTGKKQPPRKTERNEPIETIETDNSDIAIAGICNEYNNSISSCKRYSYESHLTVDGKTGLRLLTKSHNLGILITPIMNNKIYKHSFIVEHNLCCSDNKSWQDDFFSFFAILHANSISFTPDIQYHYYQRFSSVTHEATNSSTKIDNCIDVLLKIAKELHSQGIYEEYEKEYYSLVERNITSLLSMLKRGYNYSANNDFIYLYDKITMNFNMHKIISYIDSDRIFGFFNL